MTITIEQNPGYSLAAFHLAKVRLESAFHMKSIAQSLPPPAGWFMEPVLKKYGGGYLWMVEWGGTRIPLCWTDKPDEEIRLVWKVVGEGASIVARFQGIGSVASFDDEKTSARINYFIEVESDPRYAPFTAVRPDYLLVHQAELVCVQQCYWLASDIRKIGELLAGGLL